MPMTSLARNLAAAFAMVPDARRGPQHRYPLHAVLALTALAALEGIFNARDISRWRRSISDLVVSDLGFVGQQLPTSDTLNRIVSRVDRAAVREALRNWSCDRTDCPDWGRVSALRILAADERSGSVLFDHDRSTIPEGHTTVSWLDDPTVQTPKERPIRRWKRSCATFTPS